MLHGGFERLHFSRKMSTELASHQAHTTETQHSRRYVPMHHKSFLTLKDVSVPLL